MNHEPAPQGESKMIEKTVCMISGDEFQDRFMHAADVFEDSKMLAEPALFRITLAPDADLTQVIERFTDTCQKTKRVLAAVFFVGTDIGWINQNVTTVSTGDQYCPLEPMLRYYGYEGAI